MGKFLALYIGSATEADKSAAPIDGDTQSKGMAAWGAWMESNATRIVDHGGPLGPTKRASKSGISDTRNNLTGYLIVEANTLNEAARLFTDHPHFSIFPGDAVEIVECLAIPGM